MMSKIDEKSFVEYFDRYFVPLCQYAWVYCKEEERAKEIVQEVFMKIWEKRDFLEIKGAISSYLYQTVKNKSLNYLRDQKKRLVIYQDPKDTIEEEQEQNHLETSHLHKAISLLPDRCRVIFKMKKVDGLSYKEISQRLSVSEKTVENQMGIALKKLKESLINMRQSLGD